ncbi:MAG: SVM family protein [Candidatus Phytoplasma pruni]|uniref:SVM family protein n=1 Tax=16SrIII (X-disease group) TaxID=85623 RepID=UPI00036278EC|nr:MULTISPECIES: SVM family protein [16SrIII (X-disease group)]
MFKIKKQLKIIIFYLFIILVFLFIINQKIYALPGIDLNIRRAQLEEEKNNLVQELTNVFNDLTLNTQTRLNRMHQISSRIDIIHDNIQNINQQIILRNQYHMQRQNN